MPNSLLYLWDGICREIREFPIQALGLALQHLMDSVNYQEIVYPDLPIFCSRQQSRSPAFLFFNPSLCRVF
jgi:hypothetical protein